MPVPVRSLAAEVLRDDFDERYIGIADAYRVIKGLADNERLKAQFIMAPIGIDPINRTVGQALSPGNPDQLGRSPGRSLSHPPAQFEPNQWAKRFRLATLTR